MYKLDSTKTNSEYLDWSTARINGKLPLLTNTYDLYQLLGQPDSIVTPDYDNISVSYFDKNFKYAYFKKSIFEVCGDKAVLSSINFENRSDIELKTNTVTLNHNTTLDELKKLFPNAVKDKGEMDVFQIGKRMCIRLATSKYPTVDAAWLLFFVKDKLIWIEYWMPD